MYATSTLALLIVDDDSRMRELTVAAAQRCGFYDTISTADHGAAALEALCRDTDRVYANVILTDLSMPVMDGLEFTRHIRADERWSRTPVVMFSSSNQPNDREDSLAAGCVAFFEKPQTLAGLQQMLSGIPSLLKTAGAVGP